MPMRVLLIEDEEHKINDLLGVLYQRDIDRNRIRVESSVREAVLAVCQEDFDLVVLDMALPTFSDNRGRDSGGLAQAAGGLEVLRALQSCKKVPSIIIITQYPEILLSRQPVRLSDVPEVVTEKYKQNVIGAVLYAFQKPEWKEAFLKIMGNMK